MILEEINKYTKSVVSKTLIPSELKKKTVSSRCDVSVTLQMVPRLPSEISSFRCLLHCLLWKKQIKIMYPAISATILSILLHFTYLFKNLGTKVVLCHVSQVGLSTELASDIAVQVCPL